MDKIALSNQVQLASGHTLEEQISAIAVESGIVLRDGYAGFEPDPLPNVGSIAEEKGYAEAVSPWRRLMAECVNFLSIQSLMFQELLRRHPEARSAYLRASWSLSTRAAYDARCVLHLCDHGFGTQAAVVTRSCVETIEALAAFCLEPDSADAFVSAETPDQANAAWFNLVRHKARRAMDSAFAKIVHIDERTAEWRRFSRRVFGALAHPSYMASTLNMFSAWEDGHEAYPMLPARTLDSVATFQAVADSCFEYASLVQLTARGRRGSADGKPAATTTTYVNAGFFEDDWLDSYASCGYGFLQSLWLFFLEHQVQPPFSLWRAGTEATKPGSSLDNNI